MTSLALGNGVTESTVYDSRLRMSSIEAKTADQTKLLGLNYTYYNNSNVQTQQITGLGVTANQSYGYDGVNRLASASEDSSVWSRGFGYDLRGNGWVTTWTGIEPDNFTPRSASWFDAKNRLVNVGLNVGYDSAGNQTSIGAYGFGYDGENRLTQSTVNSASVTYAYDGEGRRVKRTAGGQTTVYVYSATGELAAEYGGETNGGGTQYLTVDALGSTRLVTKADAGVVCRTDYLPYGEEIAAGKGGRSALWGACSGIRQKFTGKERGDAGSENSLDYFGARYYSAAQGRFTSPDEFKGGPVDPFTGQQIQQPGPLPYADIANPQSLNKYAYVLNNPLRYTDPDGHCTAGKPDEKGPCAPLPPRVDQKALLASLGNLKINKLTVNRVANIVSNEQLGVKPGKAGAAKLDQAKAAEANAVMNADQRLGAKRDSLAATAPSSFSAAPADQTAHDREVVQQAYYDRVVNGADTAGGRIFIGNSASAIQSRPIGSGRQTTYEAFGPFSASTGKNFILIYNDPQ